jgi:membrane associated rhomboid family serine protease
VSRPDFQAPSAEVCYRHPDRPTGIRCQRCGKPICGECMNPASVGFQCPNCVRSGQATVRSPRTIFGGALSTRGGIATKVLIGVIIGMYVLDLISRGLLGGLLGMSNFAVLQGEVWRLVSYGFTSSGLFNTAFTALILWFVGRPLEDQFGALRFVLLYTLAGFGGATALYVVGAPGAGGVGGATSAVIGLLAVHTVIKLRAHEDIRPDLGLLAILVLLNLVLGWGSFGWVSIVGGIVVGGLTGAALVYPGRARRTQMQILGVLAVIVVCIAAIVIKTLVSYGGI